MIQVRFPRPLSHEPLLLLAFFSLVLVAKAFQFPAAKSVLPTRMDSKIPHHLKIRRFVNNRLEGQPSIDGTWPVRLLSMCSSSSCSSSSLHSLSVTASKFVADKPSPGRKLWWMRPLQMGYSNLESNLHHLILKSFPRWFGMILLVWSVPSIAGATTTTISSSSLEASLWTSLSTKGQLQLSLRLVTAAMLGAVIGKERSGKHHPAGVRTMCLVSMGASLFTLCSIFGFTGQYDRSRIASNIVSGVGFIGAGVITTTRSKKHVDGSLVHGLTTAAAIWLSAAVGVGCGVGLTVLSATASALTICILRIGRVAQRFQDSRRSLEDDDMWFRRAKRRIRERKDMLEEPLLDENVVYDHWNETGKEDLAP